METTIEDQVGDLSCKIFLEAGASQPDLVELLSEGTNPQVTQGPASALIKNEVGELELRHNDDRDEVSARRYPDGFLHFRYVIEYYPRPTVKHEDEVGYVARLLDRLWSRGWPAVASCDYESELPHQGGYGDDSLPWPSRPLNGLADPSRCAKELESRSPS
jgi:hypothetical protein